MIKEIRLTFAFITLTYDMAVRIERIVCIFSGNMLSEIGSGSFHLPLAWSFVLILYVSGNNFSVMSGQVFPG